MSLKCKGQDAPHDRRAQELRDGTTTGPRGLDRIERQPNALPDTARPPRKRETVRTGCSARRRLWQAVLTVLVPVHLLVVGLVPLADAGPTAGHAAAVETPGDCGDPSSSRAYLAEHACPFCQWLAEVGSPSVPVGASAVAGDPDRSAPAAPPFSVGHPSIASPVSRAPPVS
jgi:hypothetical protein